MINRSWHHRWNVLGLTMLGQALGLGIHQFTFAFWVVPWLDEFGVSRADLMLIITISSLILSFISPLIGLALDRYPPRRLYLIGSLALATGMALVSRARNHWEILAVYIAIMPIGVGLISQLSAQALITRWFTDNRGFAIGLSAAGVSLGAFVLPPVTTALLAAVGWRQAMLILAGVVLVLMLPTSALVLGRTPDAVAASTTTSRADGTQWSSANVLRRRDFWLIAGGLTTVVIAGLPLMYNIAAYARDLGISQSDAALIASMGALAFATGKIGFGRLSDLLDHALCFRLAGGCMIIGIAIVSAADRFGLLLLGQMLTLLGQGCVLPLLSGMIVARFGVASFGRIAGLATFVMGLAPLAPYVAGLIRDRSGAYPAAFLALLMPLAIAMIAMQWLSKPAVPNNKQ